MAKQRLQKILAAAGVDSRRNCEELILEGLAREFVNKVQNMRKNAGFEVTQRINIQYSSDDMVTKATDAHLEYIVTETLALDCSKADSISAETSEWDLNGHQCLIAVIPAS